MINLEQFQRSLKTNWLRKIFQEETLLGENYFSLQLILKLKKFAVLDLNISYP